MRERRRERGGEGNEREAGRRGSVGGGTCGVLKTRHRTYNVLGLRLNALHKTLRAHTRSRAVKTRHQCPGAGAEIREGSCRRQGLHLHFFALVLVLKAEGFVLDVLLRLRTSSCITPSSLRTLHTSAPRAVGTHATDARTRRMPGFHLCLDLFPRLGGLLGPAPPQPQNAGAQLRAIRRGVRRGVDVRDGHARVRAVHGRDGGRGADGLAQRCRQARVQHERDEHAQVRPAQRTRSPCSHSTVDCAHCADREARTASGSGKF